MTISRRKLLAASTAAGLTACTTNLLSANEQPRLGMIFPVIDRDVPEEAIRMYGDRIDYVVENLDLQTMTPEGYDAVIGDIPALAQKLVKQNVDAIMVMGTSLTFYQGREFNERLVQTISESTGLPVSTMSNGIINGLREVGGKNIACATAYNDVVNNRLVRFLQQHDFNVTNIEGMGIEAVGDIFTVTQPQLIDFCSNVGNTVADADAILISCGGLITLDVLEPVESRTSRPAVSSTPHALYEGAKLLGINAKVPGYGTLLARNDL
jgi:arylmalonate decarboxylase